MERVSALIFGIVVDGRGLVVSSCCRAISMGSDTFKRLHISRGVGPGNCRAGQLEMERNRIEINRVLNEV